MSNTIRRNNWNKLYRWFKALPGKSVEIAFSEFKKQDFLPKAELTWNTFISKLSAYYLYVDENDCVYQGKREKSIKPAEIVKHIPITEYEQLAQVAGIWYRVCIHKKVDYIWCNRRIYNPHNKHYKVLAKEMGIPARMIVRIKRQLNKKELDTHGLQNKEVDFSDF